MLCDILGDALVVGSLGRRFVIRHADAVRNDIGEDGVIADFGEIKSFQTEVVLAIKPQCESIHEDSFPFRLELSKDIHDYDTFFRSQQG
jgi:hypothetical protein